MHCILKGGEKPFWSPRDRARQAELQRGDLVPRVVRQRQGIGSVRATLRSRMVKLTLAPGRAAHTELGPALEITVLGRRELEQGENVQLEGEVLLLQQNHPAKSSAAG